MFQGHYFWIVKSSSWCTYTTTAIWKREKNEDEETESFGFPFWGRIERKFKRRTHFKIASNSKTCIQALNSKEHEWDGERKISIDVRVNIFARLRITTFLSSPNTTHRKWRKERNEDSFEDHSSLSVILSFGTFLELLLPSQLIHRMEGSRLVKRSIISLLLLERLLGEEITRRNRGEGGKKVSQKLEEGERFLTQSDWIFAKSFYERSSIETFSSPKNVSVKRGRMKGEVVQMQ